MSDRSAFAETFRATILSPWGAILATLLLLRPVLLQVAIIQEAARLPMSPTIDDAVNLIFATRGIGGLNIPFELPIAMVLTLLVASGAWRSSDRPWEVWFGRSAAIVSLLAAGWLVPILLIGAGVTGSLIVLPALLYFATLAFELVAWVSIMSLVAHLATRNAAVVAGVVLLIVAYTIPYVADFIVVLAFGADVANIDAFFWIRLLTPMGIAEGSQAALFPRSYPSYATTFARQVLGPFDSVWTYFFASLAWAFLPTLGFLRKTERAPEA